jgi:hypothetical protein
MFPLHAKTHDYHSKYLTVLLLQMLQCNLYFHVTELLMLTNELILATNKRETLKPLGI